MRISDADIQQYLLGNCASKLIPFTVRSFTKREEAVDMKLNVFDAVACCTHKPNKCKFGMLKFRFPVLKYWFTFTDEDDISYVATTCVILHNL